MPSPPDLILRLISYSVDLDDYKRLRTTVYIKLGFYFTNILIGNNTHNHIPEREITILSNL